MIADEIKDIQALFVNKERFKEEEITFNEKKWLVPDWASFVAQLKEIFIDKVYQFNSTSKIPVIYDCGSNVGVSINFFKQLYPEAKVVAFEADPNIFNYLKYNIKDLTNVELHDKAVWVYNGEINFNCQGADAGSLVNEFDNKCTINAIRLRDFLEKEEKIDLLKIDIEGAECEVIKDCANNLYKVDNIFIEYHSVLGRKQELNDILSVLTDNGFRYYIESLYKGQKEPLTIKNINFNMDLQLSIWAKKEVVHGMIGK